MRVHKLSFAAVALAAGLSLTACQNDGDSARNEPSSAATASVPGAGSDQAGSDQGDAKEPSGSSGQEASGKSSGGGSAGSGSDESTKIGKCRTADLEITATDSTIGGDADRSVAVELRNHTGRECAISGYPGVDLKTASGALSAQRTGQETTPGTLKPGEQVAFGINYPENTSGGSGVRVTGLVVTPPDETKSVTLAWPGAATLPVTEGGGSPVKVGPIGSAGQGG
ncbi:DUF4232 domain-containing protein [Streptomyces sp. NPDC091272]|uniref:DUF4232 domain-containing protein n=1 Tax=Streptomyces sp. NPDC091272 TaxID=3365981 RepID=UPI0037F27077